MPCRSVTLIFPKTENKRAERVRCRSVIDLSPSSVNMVTSPDWAILQLDRKLDRTPIEIDTSGVIDKSILTAFPVHYKRLRIETGIHSARPFVNGEIRKISCQSHMNGLSSTFYNHPKSPLLSLFCDNPIHNGYSGSGLISQNGKLSGVISEIIRDSDRGIYFMGTWYKPEYIEQTAGGTNAQCISAFNNNPSPACSFENNKRRIFAEIRLSFLHGTTLSESVSREVEEALATDKTIQWEDHNRDFFMTIYQHKMHHQFSALVSPPVYDYFHSSIYSLRYPKTPFCIEASRKKGGPFKLMMPKMTDTYKEMIIDNKALFVLPLKLGFLQFEMEYDATKNHFSGTMPRLENGLRKTFLELSDDLEKEFTNCMSSETPCFSLDNVLDLIENLKILSGVDESLFENENFIRYNELGAGRMILPVCEN